jgi:hypothetical protein
MVDDVLRRTGFVLDQAPVVETTPPPTTWEMELLRDVIDPLGVRQLEFLSGSRRREALETILRAEAGAPSGA